MRRTASASPVESSSSPRPVGGPIAWDGGPTVRERSEPLQRRPPRDRAVGLAIHAMAAIASVLGAA
eukprot:12917007-Alexandrium_andersonii.AAC.1